MIRICVYVYDMGVFRRAWIQSVTPDELVKLQKSKYKRILLLGEDDWYGAKAPSRLTAIVRGFL